MLKYTNKMGLIMAIKRANKTLYITYSTDYNSSWRSLFKNKNVTDIVIIKDKNNTVVVINPNYYKENKNFVNSLIQEQLTSDIANIVLGSEDLIVSTNEVISTTNNKFVVHFPNTTSISKKTLQNINIDNILKVVFDKDITTDTANLLLKHNLPFYTTKPFALLNENKFSSPFDMLTFSDYFMLGELQINSTLTPADLEKLNELFSFNKIMYSITLNSNFKQNLEIVKAYLSNTSKYSHAHFKINIDNIILNKEDSMYLYQINKLLSKNKCKLHIVTPSGEKVAYDDYTRTLTPLKKFADKINSLNLSTIEKLVLIEDYAKQRPYYDNPDDKSVSRNFFSSLNSDYIVCFTFANTFKVLCDYAKIPCTVSTSRITLYDGKVSDHAKVICNVTDDKYKFGGLYIFEPTFDSMKLDPDFDGEQPCDNYMYFASTFKDISTSGEKGTTEFGLLAYLSQNAITEEDTSEAIRQVNELYGQNLTPYSPQPEIDDAINTALYHLNTAYQIDIDTFKQVLQTSRCAVGKFGEDDLTRIVNINTIRATENFGRFSSNRFVCHEFFENNIVLLDDSIISFDFDD